MRYETLWDIDQAGLEIRLWCLQCARGTVISSDIWQQFVRGRFPIGSIRARRHFRCKVCRSKEHVLLVPAKGKPMSWKSAVEAFFHSSRAKSKRPR